MVTLKVTRIGGAEAVVLSSEAKAMLGVQAGDLLQLTRTTEGSLHIGVRMPASGKGRKRSRVAETWRELCRLLNGLDRTRL